MKQALICQTEKGCKFWWIDYEGNSYAVNFGKCGAIGRFAVKAFTSEALCLKAAEKLLREKQKNGYELAPDFDFDGRLYFDDDEYGLHPKTSHPAFRAHFADEFYYNVHDEEAPFGSDAGNDAFYEMRDILRRRPNFPVDDLPRYIVEDLWDMKYYPSGPLSAQEAARLGKTQLLDMVYSDQVTCAVAFGQIKITGKVDKALKAQALLAIERFNLCANNTTVLPEGTLGMVYRDLAAFAAVTEGAIQA